MEKWKKEKMMIRNLVLFSLVAIFALHACNKNHIILTVSLDEEQAN